MRNAGLRSDRPGPGEDRIPVAAIVGPTAAGKTELSVEIAALMGAEIVSIDSAQVYAGMDIGTAKPTPAQRARVRHHLIDVCPASHELTVAEFQLLARAAIAEIAGRGRLPLLVGGSGLYWRAVVDDLEFPPRSPDVRARLEAEAADVGGEELHARLAMIDPTAADSIEPTNVRRTVRALEVMEITGNLFSDYSHAWNSYLSRYDLTVAGLTRSRSDLWARIEARVDSMMGAGLIREAESLGPDLSSTARQTLGYRQVLEADRSGSLEEIRDAIVRATKRFARRQESWFRRDPRIVWFDASAPDIAGRLARFLENGVDESPSPKSEGATN
jgi:tRNA dimethylallyltransferase